MSNVKVGDKIVMTMDTKELSRYRILTKEAGLQGKIENCISNDYTVMTENRTAWNAVLNKHFFLLDDIQIGSWVVTSEDRDILSERNIPISPGVMGYIENYLFKNMFSTFAVNFGEYGVYEGQLGVEFFPTTDHSTQAPSVKSSSIHTCPVCGSAGDDLVFSFYCSNNSCKNYK